MDSGSGKSEMCTIGVLLVDEPVPVWRPAKARKIDDRVCQLIDQIVPEDEVWQFSPGEIVAVEVRKDERGDFLAAAREAVLKN